MTMSGSGDPGAGLLNEDLSSQPLAAPAPTTTSALSGRQMADGDSVQCWAEDVVLA